MADERSRVGQFQGPSFPYGVVLPTIHPRDNDVTPDPTLAEKDRLAALSTELFEQLRNKRLDDTK